MLTPAAPCTVNSDCVPVAETVTEPLADSNSTPAWPWMSTIPVVAPSDMPVAAKTDTSAVVDTSDTPVPPVTWTSDSAAPAAVMLTEPALVLIDTPVPPAATIVPAETILIALAELSSIES